MAVAECLLARAQRALLEALQPHQASQGYAGIYIQIHFFKLLTSGISFFLQLFDSSTFLNLFLCIKETSNTSKLSQEITYNNQELKKYPSRFAIKSLHASNLSETLMK